MGYYDNVKDSVRDNGNDTDEDDSGDMSDRFSTLKEEAQKTSPEEEEGDDTPIEILEDGLEQEPKNSKQGRSSSPDRGQRDRTSSGDTQGSRHQNRKETGSTETPDQKGSRNSSTDSEEIVKRLDRIIEQNEKMIEILESFGR
ncbi:MAG: hypothetical protein ABEJ75_00500 [Candidatus Nanohaloarchaea archaeon]